MRTTKLTAILLAQALATLLIIGCQTEEEQEILDSIDKGVAAIEGGDLKGAVKSTSRDFLAYPGKINRGALMWRLKSIFESRGGFSVHFPIPDIELGNDGESALLEGQFIISPPGFNAASLQEFTDDPEAWTQEAQEHSEVHQAQLRMVKSGDRWLIETLRVF